MKLPLLLISFLLLSSCTIDWGGEKEKKIADLEKQVQELKSSPYIFEKQKECIDYKNAIEKVIQNNLEMGRNAQKSAGRNDYIHNEELRDIFYSPIKNSCLYVVYVTETYLEDGLLAKGDCESYVFRDFLSTNNQYLIRSTKGKYDEIPGMTAKRCDNTNVYSEYLDILNELKGEQSQSNP